MCSCAADNNGWLAGNIYPNSPHQLSIGWTDGVNSALNVTRIACNPYSDPKDWKTVGQLFFCPSAAEMKEFHEFAHKVWNRQESRTVTESLGFFKEEDVPVYFDILDRVKSKTVSGSVFHKRICALEDNIAFLKNYFQIVASASGAIWDQSLDSVIIEKYTLPKLWNSGAETCVKKYDDHWDIEVMIPLTEDFVGLYPHKNNPWGVNVCRQRAQEDSGVTFSISPTGKKHAAVTKWGNIVVI